MSNSNYIDNLKFGRRKYYCNNPGSR